MTLDSPIRINLCTPLNQVGCGFVVVLFGSLLIPMLMSGKPAVALAMLLFFLLPFSPLIWKILFEFQQTLGREIEISKEHIALYRKGELEWKVNKGDLSRGLRIGHELHLVDRDGQSYRFLTMNLARPQLETIWSSLPPGFPIEVAEPTVLPRMSRSVAYAVIAVGGIATVFGLTIVASLKPSEDTVPNFNLVISQGISLILGITAILIGLINLKPLRRNVTERGSVRLSSHFFAGDSSPYVGKAQTWVPIQGSTNVKKVFGQVLVFALIFWTSVTAVVVYESIRNPSTSFLLWGYGLIMVLHLWAAVHWTKLLSPEAWQIRTDGDNVEVSGHGVVLQARVKRSGSSYSLYVEYQGKSRYLDAKEFIPLTSDIDTLT